MRRIVVEALRAGAIGFATSTLEQHNGEHGIPMPSRLADERELLALTGAPGAAGRGGVLLTDSGPPARPRLGAGARRTPPPVQRRGPSLPPRAPTPRDT